MFKVGFISFLSVALTTVAVANCRPKPNPNLPQYMVGYGSLMNQKSKQRTAPNTGESLPVMITGFQRGWYAYGCHNPALTSTTFLGIRAQAGAKMNAVIFKIPQPSDIARYDARESGYCRVPVKRQQIKLLAKKVEIKGQYWVYLPKHHDVAKPTKQCPLVQSYVDLFIGGCLNLQAKFHLTNFAKACITDTAAWSPYWVNDRIYPRRPFIYEPQAEKIDKLLYKTIPAQFKSRRVE